MTVNDHSEDKKGFSSGNHEVVSSNESQYTLNAQASLHRILRWKDAIIKEAKAINVPSSVVAAMISRETEGLDKWCLPPNRGGKLGDDRDGPGPEKGRGHGPMQIDIGSFPEWCEKWRRSELTTEEGIKQGCVVLQLKMRAIARLIPEMPEELRLEAAIAAYNSGEGRVRQAYRAGKPVGAYTAHGTYVTDVMERVEVFKQHGFE